MILSFFLSYKSLHIEKWQHILDMLSKEKLDESCLLVGVSFKKVNI